MLRRAGLCIESARLHILPHIAVVVGHRCFRVSWQRHVERGARLGLLVAEEEENILIIPAQCGQGMHSVANLHQEPESVHYDDLTCSGKRGHS